MNLSFWVHCSARNHKQTFREKNQWTGKCYWNCWKTRCALCFFMLKNCFSLPKSLYFLRTSTCFNHSALLENYDKTVRDGLSIVCKVNFDDISSTQLSLPAEMGGLGVSSASLLALPAFLASVFGATDFLTTIFSKTFEDVSFTKALEK